MSSTQIITGDCRQILCALPDGYFHMCVTSPPYFGLRDYGHVGQVGAEQSPEPYIAALVETFREVRRVLRDDGTLWLNLGDSYRHGGNGSRDPTRWPKQSRNDHQAVHAKKNTGARPKELLGIPWRVAFALQADGWYLRQEIIWAKPNPMPESVRDRCTKSHEHIFLMTKSERYYFDADAIAEPAVYAPGGSHTDVKQGGFNDKGPTPGTGQRSFRAIRTTRNKRDVWTVPTRGYKDAHFATFPTALIEPCVLAGSPVGGVVLDPFGGAGTTGMVANKHDRDAFLIELNPEYAAMAERRIKAAS